MKTKIVNHLATLFIVLCAALSKAQTINNRYPGESYMHTNADSAIINSPKLNGKLFWGEINAGYSTDGAAGSLTLNYRIGKMYFGTRYYKSHICYEDNKQRDYRFNDGSSDNHFTIESMSLFSGVMFEGKWAPSLSVGVSLCQFKYASTVRIEHNVTLPRIWETIMNRDYKEEMLNSRTVRTIGIPVEFKLHFATKHFVGFDAGIKAEVNTHSTFVSAQLGIRFGRVTRTNSERMF